MNYHKFAKIYSYSRTSRYLKAAKGNKKKAQEMFYANARLARSFQPLISFFEVVLRNQLHYALLSGVPCTIFNGLPTGVGRKKINQKIQQIRKLRNRISHSEPLCFKDKSFDMTYVCDMYDIIHDFMSWINPNIVPTISKENLNQVKSEIAAIEVILKK